MTDPFRIEGPALISFSGGRTSGYMLKRILDAHDGQMPPDVHVAFANTGKEREETLRFVHECSTRWNVRVRWLEWKDCRDEYIRKEGAHRCWYDEVGYNSASRNGEPFDALISYKGNYLPNGAQRFCSEQLKVLTMHRFMGDIGHVAGSYTEVIGLRSDEQHRLLKMAAQNATNGRRCVAPLATDGVTVDRVMAFWRAQDFDLGLEPWEGNCTLCFQKGKGIRKRIIRDNPTIPRWWLEKEIQCGGTWDKRDSVGELVAQVNLSPVFDIFDTSDPDDEHDAECGLWCTGEAP